MRRVSFGKVGSVRTVPLMRQPEQGEGESPEVFQRRLEEYERLSGVSLEVEILPRAEYAEWSLDIGAVYAAEDKRQHDGEVAPMGLTKTGLREIAEVQRALLRRCLVAVHGIDVDGKPSEEITDRGELAELIEECDLLGHAAIAAKEAQNLRRDQADS